MALAKSLKALLARRLATQAARFRLAFSLGFVIAAVGFATIAVNDRDGIADTIFGLQDLFGGARESQQADAAASGWLGPRRHRLDRRAHLRSIERARADDGPLQLGRRSMCVRLCDGFAFPVGLYHGDEDRAAHESTCRSECPGAATALYIQPAGSDSMDEAARVGTGRTYSELPYAFHYTTVLSDTCTCHPRDGNKIKSLLHDFTLRRGDAVMTSTGFEVFHGAARFPYRRGDFVALSQSRDVRQGDRAAFHAIERASLRTTPNVVAEVAPSVRPKPMARGAAKGLEHQANLAPARSDGVDPRSDSPLRR